VVLFRGGRVGRNKTVEYASSFLFTKINHIEGYHSTDIESYLKNTKRSVNQ